MGGGARNTGQHCVNGFEPGREGGLLGSQRLEQGLKLGNRVFHVLVKIAGPSIGATEYYLADS